MASENKNKLTPMMEQWHHFRDRLPRDTLLLFRLGDFYEVFNEDAEEGARLLGITLTRRHGMPMAGIPYHAADNYVDKLLAAGKKVAICDQVETPRAGKLVKRELTRILTPGTILEERQLQSDHNHFLLAVEVQRRGVGAAWMDLSTGVFEVAFQPMECAEKLLTLFSSLDPREVLFAEGGLEVLASDAAPREFGAGWAAFMENRPLTNLERVRFDRDAGFRCLTDLLGVLNLEGFGLEKDHPALGAAGALLHYATDTLCSPPKNLGRVREHRLDDILLLDPATQRNLEIFRGAGGTRRGSLLQAMNRTVTAAGARLLEHFLHAPTRNLNEVERRKLSVRGLVQEPSLTGELRQRLREVRDLSRILGRLQNRIRNPRELAGIRETLHQLPSIAMTLLEYRAPEVRALAGRIENFSELSALLQSALDEEPPSRLQDGGVIRTGYDAELDRLRGLARDNQKWLTELEAAEQKRTGIKNLKIKYNGAFGYFIEVTKSNLALVPEDYIRKQTMVNAERYYTEDLKQKEKEILNAEERGLVREEALFRELVSLVLKEAEPLRSTAAALAEADCFAGWAQLAREWSYCEPELDDSADILIEQGRHPVVEQMMREDRVGLAGTHAFVPNDTQLSADEEQIAVITGPNMAGKSTYIRQVALITLMACVGCWVPARSCRIGKVDRIFSRVGASDELARGNSTFMVEMNETANILNHATPESLIILDEIGRGTSTYDGLSIAWAVVEHLHGPGMSGPRTLFATHYHELTQLSQALARVRNYTVSVKEWNDEIVFVRQVVPGGADRSYGIQVARLAGLPEGVIKRAKDILQKLESDDSSHNLLRRRLRQQKKSPQADTSPFDDQLELFR